MGKVLVIAEKPDAGRNMAKVLKCDNCKDGYIENEKYIVTWAVGHLIGLKMPEEHNPALKEWKISTLPLIFDIDDSLKVLPDTKKQFEIVKKLIHRPDVDYLINAVMQDVKDILYSPGSTDMPETGSLSKFYGQIP